MGASPSKSSLLTKRGLELNLQTCKLRPGSAIAGSVLIEKSLEVCSIKIILTGTLKTVHTTNKDNGLLEGARATQQRKSSTKEIFYKEKPLKVSEEHLEKTKYPFNLETGAEMHPSFSEANSRMLVEVKYEVVVRATLANGFFYEEKKEVWLEGPNTPPKLALENSQIVNASSFKYSGSGTIRISSSIDKQAYLAQDRILLKIWLENNSNCKINKVIGRLTRVIEFQGLRDELVLEKRELKPTQEEVYLSFELEQLLNSKVYTTQLKDLVCSFFIKVSLKQSGLLVKYREIPCLFQDFAVCNN